MNTKTPNPAVKRDCKKARRETPFALMLSRVIRSWVQAGERDGENGLLVDFYSPAEIAERVVAGLAAGRNGYADIRCVNQRADFSISRHFQHTVKIDGMPMQ